MQWRQSRCRTSNPFKERARRGLKSSGLPRRRPDERHISGSERQTWVTLKPAISEKAVGGVHERPQKKQFGSIFLWPLNSRVRMAFRYSLLLWVEQSCMINSQDSDFFFGWNYRWARSVLWAAHGAVRRSAIFGGTRGSKALSARVSQCHRSARLPVRRAICGVMRFTRSSARRRVIADHQPGLPSSSMTESPRFTSLLKIWQDQMSSTVAATLSFRGARTGVNICSDIFSTVSLTVR
jgi:hypothetical protein